MNSIHTRIAEIRILIEDLMLLCMHVAILNISDQPIKVRRSRRYVNTIEISECRKVYIQCSGYDLNIFVLDQYNHASTIYIFREDTGYVHARNITLATRVIDICFRARDELMISMTYDV